MIFAVMAFVCPFLSLRFFLYLSVSLSTDLLSNFLFISLSIWTVRYMLYFITPPLCCHTATEILINFPISQRIFSAPHAQLSAISKISFYSFFVFLKLYLFIHPRACYCQCCGSGSGIRCLFDPWIRDPGWVKTKKSRSGSGIRDEQPGSPFFWG